MNTFTGDETTERRPRPATETGDRDRLGSCARRLGDLVAQPEPGDVGVVDDRAAAAQAGTVLGHQRLAQHASGLVCLKEQVDLVDGGLLLGHECLELSDVELWVVGGVRWLRGSRLL